MTEQLAELTEESELLRKRHDQARLELQEATTKLAVLTQYFKDKELELQRWGRFIYPFLYSPVGSCCLLAAKIV